MSCTKTIPIEEAMEGMVLSGCLSDSNKNVLLPANTILTASMIGSLRRHEVGEITIAVNSDLEQAADDRQLELILAEKIKRIDLLFVLHEKEAANAQLKQCLINFIKAGQ